LASEEGVEGLLTMLQSAVIVILLATDKADDAFKQDKGAVIVVFMSAIGIPQKFVLDVHG